MYAYRYIVYSYVLITLYIILFYIIEAQKTTQAIQIE